MGVLHRGGDLLTKNQYNLIYNKSVFTMNAE